MVKEVKQGTTQFQTLKTRQTVRRKHFGAKVEGISDSKPFWKQQNPLGQGFESIPSLGGLCKGLKSHLPMGFTPHALNVHR